MARFASPKFQGRSRTLDGPVYGLSLRGPLGWYSIEFIKWDFIDGTPGVGVVPAWVCETIIPVAAAVMAVRYLRHAIWPQRKETS